MNREETVKIIRVICTTYPNFNPENLSDTVDVWQSMLEGYSYEQISRGLKAYILSDASGFAPTIGQIVAKAQIVSQPMHLNEMEAWSLVSKAIRNSSYHAEEEFAKLPPVVQRAVGMPNQLRTWAIDEEYNEQVVSSNFIKCYRAELDLSKKMSRMSDDIKELTSAVNENSYPVMMEKERRKSISVAEKRKQQDKLFLETCKRAGEMSDEMSDRLEDLKRALAE